jgi:hypothetical protein
MPFRFLLKLILFGIPAGFLMLAPLGVAMYMGEAMPISRVVAMQLGDTPVLYGPSDRETIFAYKLASVEARAPEVLFVGSSRLLQCRAQLLNQNPRAFYNAGAEGWTLREIRALIEQLDANTIPNILVIGLDQPWFNARFVDWEPPHNLNTGDIEPQRAFASARRVLDAVIGGNIQVGALFERREWVRGGIGLGLNALSYGRGYRNDGSHQEGDLLIDPALGELGRSNDLGVVEDGWRQYVEGNRVDQSMIEAVSSFLDMARERGITVIGVSPPFMPSIYEQMMADGRHNYLSRSTERLTRVFAQHHLSYFDFSNAAWVGGTDEEMYDGWHPSEKLCLRMYVEMLRDQPELLNPYSDLQALEGLLATADNPLEVFARAG